MLTTKGGIAIAAEFLAEERILETNNNAPFWIVTGAASGIGASVVRAVRRSGAEVLALDVNDELGLVLAEQTGAHYRHCDISQPEHWQKLIEFLNASRSALGAPTHVHLNAGIQIAPPDAALSEYQLEMASVERYRRMMGVNVDGVVFGLQSLLPLMGEGSAIVVTASLAGVTPYAIDPLYAMSKHAVVGLVRSLAPTLAKRGIHIHALCPGGVDTALVPVEQRHIGVRFMTPEDLANDVIGLMGEPVSGKSWVRVSAEKPRFVIRAPGDRTK